MTKWFRRPYEWGLPKPIRRYRVGYALADGNTYESPFPPFFKLSMAERYADWFRKRLTRRWPTNAVFVTDLEDPERGDVYGTEEE